MYLVEQAACSVPAQSVPNRKVSVYIYTHIYTYIYIHVCVCVCVCVSVSVSLCVYIYNKSVLDTQQYREIKQQLVGLDVTQLFCPVKQRSICTFD